MMRLFRNHSNSENTQLNDQTESSDATDYNSFKDSETPITLYVYTVNERNIYQEPLPQLNNVPIANFFLDYQEAIKTANLNHPQESLKFIKITMPANLFYAQKELADFDILTYEVDMNEQLKHSPTRRSV
jgi:hypothetical protein